VAEIDNCSLATVKLDVTALAPNSDSHMLTVGELVQELVG